jgi:hypothetical protein
MYFEVDFPGFAYTCGRPVNFSIMLADAKTAQRAFVNLLVVVL